MPGTQLMLNKWELQSLRQSSVTDGNPDKTQGVPGRQRCEDERTGHGGSRKDTVNEK